MGPGLLLKALLHGSFSLLVFGWAQIIMDLQPLFVLISGTGHLHGFSHTYLGATLIGVFCAATGKFLGEFTLRQIDIPWYRHNRILWRVAMFSSFLGTFSHVALDSIMHFDMAPYFPFSDGNHLLRLMSVDALHRFCIYTGTAGIGVFFLLNHLIIRRKSRTAPAQRRP